MRRALLENLPEDYKVYREVPLGEIFRPEECQSGEVREYVENSRIDFLICKGGEALLAIEVDGAQHRRADPEQENCDSLKDGCFEKMSGKIEYLRISTAGADGTYQSEVDNIRRLCAKAEKFNKRRRFDNSGGRAIEADAEELKDVLAMYLRSFLENDCLDGVKNFYREHGGVPQLEYSSYNSIQDIDYGDAAANQYYFCKFGLAYAFEYSLLYEIMLRIADTNQFGVNSFGCGGYIDAWALAYSWEALKARCQEVPGRIYYRGTDRQLWNLSLFGRVDSSGEARFTEPISGAERTVGGFRLAEQLVGDITDFCDKPGSKIYYNALMFPKILNELDSKTLESFAENLASAEFARNECYICVSHSPSKLEKGVEAIGKILNVFKKKGYGAEDDLEKLLGQKAYGELCERLFKETELKSFSVSQIGGSRVYSVVSPLIGSLNPDFSFQKINGYLWELSDSGVDYCRQMTRANIAFQIIKLTK